MKNSHPDTIESAKLDLEVDFGEHGGLQRFKNVTAFNAWISEEREFWSWLNEEPARTELQQIGGQGQRFWQFADQSQQVIQQQSKQWAQRTQERERLREILENPESKDDQKTSSGNRIAEIEKELEEILERLRRDLHAQAHGEIAARRHHLLGSNPCAHFIKKIAEADPASAVHTLSYFLGSEDRRHWQAKGQVLAILYKENLNKKVRPEQAAFKKAIETWTRELEDFKARFEEQETEFEEISERHADAEQASRVRHDELAAEFGAMRQAAEAELKALKDTYDGFMQLEAPREYWGKKSQSHARGRKLMAILATICAVLGAGGLGTAAWHLLPESQSSGSIPWRQIGFFVLASTFVLWIVKLLVRLMLSHIHLYEDAKEREVMISTFLALMNHQESREGLKKEDIALVLAPIFRPSTTGVIKDDGGPQSFGELLKALTGGK